MSSQPVSATLRTPLPSGRKRCLSASAAETEVKKHKGNSENHSRQFAKAKRSILLDQDSQDSGSGSSASASGRKEKSEDDPLPNVSNNREGDTDIKTLLRKLSDDMLSMHNALNKKIGLVETMIEQSEKKITEKVTDKITKIIDKRVNTETARLRKEIDDKIQGLRDDFNGEINQIYAKLESEQRENFNTSSHDRQLRIVVRNLPETVNEIVKEKVDAVIKDGLKMRDVTVLSAERKTSRYESKPGVVIAKFRNADKDSRQYNKVYINHDLSREERNLASNMRTLLNGVKRGQNLHVRGSRIVAESGSTDREYGERRSEESRGRQNGSFQTRENVRSHGYGRDNSSQRYRNDRTRNVDRNMRDEEYRRGNNQWGRGSN